MQPLVSVILPLCTKDEAARRGIRSLASSLLRCDRIELIVVDNTPGEGVDPVGRLASRYRYFHVSWCRPTANAKLLNVQFGIREARGDVIALIDDDVRPSVGQILSMAQRTPRGGTLRPMVRLRPLSLANSIDQASIYLVNVFCKDRQFWGIQVVSADLREGLMSMPADRLFDELCVHRVARRAGAEFRYAGDILVDCITRRSTARFLEQRLRYAYENLAYPVRSALLASFLPTLLVLQLFGGPALLLLGAIAAGAGVYVAAFFGWLRFGRPHRLPLSDCLYGPSWLLFNAALIWLALALRLTVGVRFAGGRYSRAA